MIDDQVNEEEIAESRKQRQAAADDGQAQPTKPTTPEQATQQTEPPTVAAATDNVPQSFVHRSDTEAPTRELNIRCTPAATADTRAPAQPRPRVQSLARLPHGSARCTAFLLVRASLRRRR